MTRPADDPRAIVEVVCMGNICRSPYAQALLRAAAAERVEDPSLVLVRSSGVRGLTGESAAEGSVLEAARRGLDLGSHVAATWSESRIREADVVITMSVAQRSHIVQHVGDAAAKSFTIRELARLLSHARPDISTTTPRARLTAVAESAHAARATSPPPPDPEDVADPYGGPPEGYARMAAQLDRLVLTIADDLFGPLPNVDEHLFARA